MLAKYEPKAIVVIVSHRALVNAYPYSLGKFVFLTNYHPKQPNFEVPQYFLVLQRYLETQGFAVRGVGDGAQMQQAREKAPRKPSQPSALKKTVDAIIA